jgi:two-component system sensor histidine kinase AtoS
MACLMAHEIRNPLGGIRGYVDLIAESLEKDDPRKKMVDHILKSILRLDEIVANFQLFTRPVKPHFEEVDLSRFLTDVLTFFQDSTGLKEKSIQLAMNLDNENQPIRVRIDPILLEQSLLAVLDNAVKAMKMGGVIRVELTPGVSLQKRGENVVSIIITDSGEGMSKDVLQELFTPFYTTREKGLGLGLSMARNFISLQRGDIFVESEEGMGTTVTILLPLI